MALARSLCSFLELLLISAFLHRLTSTNAQSYDYPTANVSTLWTNTPSSNCSLVFSDGTTVRVILLRYGRTGSGSAYACGFYCYGTCARYMLAIFIVHTDDNGGLTVSDVGSPPVIWSANRNYPVKVNSTLELTMDGDLVLKDADGTIAWSTETSGKSVVAMTLTEEGNLMLFDTNKVRVWQSFDYPTDSLVPGQRLMAGQKLTASVSSTNWTEFTQLSFTMTQEGLFGLMETDPLQVYFKALFGDFGSGSNDTFYVKYLNGSLALFLNSKFNSTVISIHTALTAQYMKLGSDGHLRVYEWSLDSESWTQVGDLLTGYLGGCGYPMVCGDNGICTNGQCSCPDFPESSHQEAYFRPINDREPDLGCSAVTPLSCAASQHQTFVELKDVFYFATYFNLYGDLKNTDQETCKHACSRDCSCKAAIFQYGVNSSGGSCHLLSQVFSLMNNEKDRTHRNSTTFIKVQKSLSTKRKTKYLPVVLGLIFGVLFALVILIGLVIWKMKDVNEAEEDHLDLVPGMPTRFSYEGLKSATKNFSTKIGEGGSGSVFEGTLINGTKVAVKQLEGLCQVKNSFLAEVETIGSIHHVNLMRLVGFCADKSHRLLVYEYMPNGSLDRWLFHKKNGSMLSWKQRKKIILDIAKGINYLHEDCRQKIIHMDIKPQNILLDMNFNAKLSDFGLSKLIDRDQTQVMTTMRGTPGYLAPEWLSAAISEKVDVYSFGVVILEIVCGRKVLDNSLNEEYMHLLSLFKRKAKESKLLDMVDKHSEDMQLQGPEAVNMMRIAAWCLQGDSAKRPSMSMVVKALECAKAVEVELDSDLINTPWTEVAAEFGCNRSDFGSITGQSPCVLSGPR